MQRIAHGATDPNPDSVVSASEALNAFNSILAVKQAPTYPVCYLFPDLHKNPDAFLPESASTLTFLSALGETMRDTEEIRNNSGIPAAYTYLGQFIDHDVALTDIGKTTLDLTNLYHLTEKTISPWSKDEVLAKVRNARKDPLNLECLYASDPAPPRYGGLMSIGKVTESGYRPDGKDDDNDLPRQGRSSDPRTDRGALIADSRNDQNLIISQLHLAFLRAHNAIVRKGRSFYEAQELLRQHYHWIIIDDYLNLIADPKIVAEVRQSTQPVYTPTANNRALPLEFSVAAFRFGHSMIRDRYYYNRNFNAGGLELPQLFTRRALDIPTVILPDQPCGTLPENKIIEWRKFLANGVNVTKRIDTLLVNPLFDLDQPGQPQPVEPRLSVSDLKRAYQLRVPTGQAVAGALDLPVMTPAEIEAVPMLDYNVRQRDVLVASGFSTRTPLWFYILAEAVHHDPTGENHHLGPVGSRLVAEVLIGLIRNSSNSILKPTNPPWAPMLGKTAGVFTLADLLELAGVLEDLPKP